MASPKFLLPKPANRETNCGNAIAKIGKKKFCGNCGNAIAENGKKKKIVVAKITYEELKKKSATSTIFLQHFHNKSQVINYYYFKFEFNNEITFLIQQ